MINWHDPCREYDIFAMMRKTGLDRKEIKMFSNVSNNISAAVAAIFTAAIFVGASVGPAVSHAASVVA
ncbi:MAG: hypothetical protein COZ43_03400 [Sphingomonadales bacterium CG_4_10_14_3_um_filter_58_15]|nr:MAG: hypothetical protein COZ43_03400 [Sphingomonadales bacterium CG_4_10_14_3_um_filter_58_15]